METEIKKLSLTVPFEGFYESSHDYQFDNYIEQDVDYLRDEYGATTEQIGELHEKYHWGMNWKKAHEMYAKEYVSQLEAFIKGEGKEEIKLEFEELNSPKEYNFTTDRIFAKILPSDVITMYDRVDKLTLNKAIEARFTSYDGFASFYPNSLSAWPAEVLDWDHNQLGCLLEAYLEVILETDDIYEKLKVWDLMESAFCNGFIENVVWQCVDQGFKDYYNILTAEKVENNNG